MQLGIILFGVSMLICSSQLPNALLLISHNNPLFIYFFFQAIQDFSLLHLYINLFLNSVNNFTEENQITYAAL